MEPGADGPVNMTSKAINPACDPALWGDDTEIWHDRGLLAQIKRTA